MPHFNQLGTSSFGNVMFLFNAIGFDVEIGGGSTATVVDICGLLILVHLGNPQ